jgi:hypothetical protein
MDVTKVSEAVWDRAHAAARPWIGTAGIVAALASVLAGVGLLVGGDVATEDVFSAISGVIGVGAIGVFAIKAEGAARRAAKSPELPK